MTDVALTRWHRFAPGGVRWRLVEGGVEVEGCGVERTPGRPVTAERVWAAHGAVINAVIGRRQMPAELVVATICTESTGRAEAIRFEPGYVSDAETPQKVSPGIMQTLISTASWVLGTPVTREWLLEPGNSIDAGCAYIARQAPRTRLDPPLVAAAYNSGGLYEQAGAGNRWRLRQYPIGTGRHCDRFVRFYNDAVAVVAGHRARPHLCHRDLLAT